MIWIKFTCKTKMMDGNWDGQLQIRFWNFDQNSCIDNRIVLCPGLEPRSDSEINRKKLLAPKETVELPTFCYGFRSLRAILIKLRASLRDSELYLKWFWYLCTQSYREDANRQLILVMYKVSMCRKQFSLLKFFDEVGGRFYLLLTILAVKPRIEPDLNEIQ